MSAVLGKEKQQTVATIAKQIRSDLKLHLEAGTLPEGKYDVKTDGAKIRITVQKVVLSPLLEPVRGHHGVRYTSKALELLNELEKIAAEHEQPEGDPAHFSVVVNFATHLSDRELDRT